MNHGIKKLLVTMSLAFCLFGTVFATQAKAEDAAPVYERKVLPYTAQEVSDFLSGTDSYPSQDGYLFAGWYTDEKCDDTCYLGTNEPSGQMYALFIPEQVLGVQAQIKAALTDGDVTDDDKVTSLRFVTSVDSLNYREVGFYVTYTIGGQEYTSKSASKKVYEELYYVDSTEGKMSVKPQELFCNLSTYFKAGTVLNLPESFYEMEFTVQPFWVTMEGDMVKGDAVVKSVDMGCIKEEVYVSSSTDAEGNPIAADKSYYGSEEHPYASLDYAIAHVENKGTVRVKDSLTVASDATWTAHNKTITITGNGNAESAETLDFSNLDPAQLHVADNVTFGGLDIQFPTYVFCNGYRVTVAEDVNFIDASKAVTIYGGGYKNHVKGAHLELYAGTYAEIFGGAHEANVNGDITVVVGGNVNPKATGTDHKARNYMLYGAGRRGTINGDISLTVQEGAKFDCVYGGGGSLSSGSVVNVKGDINVEFAGKTYSLYGGGRYGTNANTHVKLVGGQVYQLFGGCEHKSMTGNTSVEVLGGNVLRRIYGGCYNNYEDGKWATTNHVTGTTSVTIGTNVSLNKESDNALCAISRCESKFEDENGVLIFQNDLYSSLSGKVQNLWGSHAYNYLVIASVDGEVAMTKNGLSITPDNEKKALVRLDSATGTVDYVADKAGTYALPELVEGTRKVYVTFPETLPTVAVSVADSANGTVTTDSETYYIGSTVTLTVTPDDGYYCTALTVTKDGEAVAVSPAFKLGQKTYTFDVQDGAYIVEASFGRQVFKHPSANPTNTSWDVTEQCLSEETLANGGTKISGIVYATDLQEKDRTDSLEFVDKYTDMDLTYVVKDDPTCAVGSTTPGTTLTLSFEGYSYQVRAVKNGDNIVLRVVAGMSKNTNMYTFTDEQATKFASAEGIEVRAVRSGTEVHFFVDGTYAYTADLATLNSDVVATDTEMEVNFKRFGDTGTKVAIPFTMINKVNVSKVTVKSATNGSIKADGVIYNVGDTATLTVAPKSGYYCNSLIVKKDGVAIALDKEVRVQDTTYSFVVENGAYTVEATFAKKVFDNPSAENYTSWNLMTQNESMETLANGGTKITGTIYSTDLQEKDKMNPVAFADSFTEIDLTYVVKDDPSTTVGNATPGTQLVLDFNGYAYHVRAVKNSGNIVLRVVGGMSANTNMYTFTEEQAAKFASAEGVAIRVVRCGTEVVFYVDGAYAYSADLSELNTLVTADREMVVSLRRFGDTGVAVAIPFTVINKATPFVSVGKTTNGTVTKDKEELYSVGDTATLTVAPSSGYYCNSLTVKKGGEVIALDKELNMTDTTYSFEVEDASYTVEATFVKKIFTTPSTQTKTVWNLVKQNEKTETLSNGGTKVSGTLYSTCVVSNDGTDVLSFASKYTDMDLSMKVKDDPSTTTGNSTPGTTVTFDFSSYVFQVRAVKNDGNIVLRVLNGLSSKENVYKFTSAQADKFASSEGVDFRMVRIGTNMYLYVDGTLAYTLDLGAQSVALKKTEVTATTKMAVNIRRYGDQNVAVAIPYSVCDKPSPVAVEVKDASGKLVANEDGAFNVQKIDLASNATYSVKLSPQGMDGYFKITYVDHVTNATQSVYTPAVAAGGSFAFTYQNGVFDVETEANIASSLWEHKTKAIKDVLTVELIAEAPEGDVIEANAVVGREPMEKPLAETVETNWTVGAVASTGEVSGNANYAYTDVITVPKKGTKITFTDSVKTDSWATGDVYVISSWKQNDASEWVFDAEGTSIAGQFTTGEVTCTEGYETFIERYADDKITYTYITSKNNENIRLCYFAGEGPTSYPKISMIYCGEIGTAEEIALATNTNEWLENDKNRAYYDMFEGKTISVIGDSYMAGSSIADPADVWVNMFATKYNVTINNHGVNGSTISNYAGAKYNPMVDRWREDFANDTPDIIIVEGGRNDYNYNTPMGKVGTADKGTMKGATTYLISSLKEKYPNAIIIGITCWEVGGNQNAAGYYCSDYGRAFIEVCESLEIPYVNAMDSEDTNVYMTVANFRGRFCIKAGDISHLNEKGMKLVLPIFEEKIYNICK